jgi:hypothetical protein
MTAETKQWWITGGIVAVLVLLLWWGVTHKRPASAAIGTADTVATTTGEKTALDVTAPAPTVRPTTASAIASGETVTIDDQPAGETVALSQATLKAPSWIAVRDTAGRVLGAHWFATSVENQTFSLLRATKAGEVYQAVIYVDNGDKKFDLHADTLLTSSEDAPVSSTFRAQ